MSRSGYRFVSMNPVNEHVDQTRLAVSPNGGICVNLPTHERPALHSHLVTCSVASLNDKRIEWCDTGAKQLQSQMEHGRKINCRVEIED